MNVLSMLRDRLCTALSWYLYSFDNQTYAQIFVFDYLECLVVSKINGKPCDTKVI